MFLYFNDNVILGREVWPDNFYSAREGHKVRVAWPLPDCAPGCKFSWIKDG
jgi:UDP-N-acetylglucosamine-lysosomal-enzyme